jgi:DNA-directed RNA polymerase specialized sigma subunit
MNNYHEAMQALTADRERQIAADITGSTMTYPQIGQKYEVSESFVSRVAYKFGIQRKRGMRRKVRVGSEY